MPTVIELAHLVQLMRAAQKDYFAERTRHTLTIAKNLEQKVDRIVLQILGAQAAQLRLGEVADETHRRV